MKTHQQARQRRMHPRAASFGFWSIGFSRRQKNCVGEGGCHAADYPKASQCISATARQADIDRRTVLVGYVPILLQKSLAEVVER
jgi:hypothetical protein